MKGKIELLGMKFHAFHGCLPEERKNGNSFVVDFVCNLDLEDAAASDCLSDTLDYSSIYSIVSREMSIPSNLLENVAGRIIKSINAAYPELRCFSVRVSKACPPVDGPVRESAVTLYYEPNED